MLNKITLNDAYIEFDWNEDERIVNIKIIDGSSNHLISFSGYMSINDFTDAVFSKKVPINGNVTFVDKGDDENGE